MITIEQVYQQVPNVKCKGKCQEACGLIACSSAEAENMANNGIIPPQTKNHPTLGELTCTHLTNDGKCAIYEHRPLICRLYGAVKKMKCPHGCQPKGGFLTEEKARELLNVLEQLNNKPCHIASI